MNPIIKRTLSNGQLLEIFATDLLYGRMLIAHVDGIKAASGGLSPLRNPIPGYAKLACGRVPVTPAEAAALQTALGNGRKSIDKKQAAARAYNDLMNEGEEGYTPHNF